MADGYLQRISSAVSPIFERPDLATQVYPYKQYGPVGPLVTLGRGALSGLDFLGRAAEAVPAAIGAIAGEAYEDITGDDGMSNRLERDIRALALIGEVVSPVAVTRVGRGAVGGANMLDLVADTRRVSRGEAPKFRVIETGDGRIVVTPRDGPRKVREGERSLTRDEISDILSDPNVNLAYQTADEYSRKALGVPYDLAFELPESGIIKQAAIGRVYRDAAAKSPEYRETVFDAYRRQMPEVVEEAGAKNFDDLVGASYDRLAKETKAQFEALPIQTNFGGREYGSAAEMFDDVIRKGNLNVFRGGDRHEFLHNVDPAYGLNENEMFRAVHDYFGHGIRGNAFGPLGEEIAYASHSKMYSPLARAAMAAETRGQNSFVNFTPVNAADSLRAQELKDMVRRGEASAADIQQELDAINARQVFAEQSATILPPEMLDINYPGGIPDYLRGIIRPAPGTEVSTPAMHYSKSPDLQFTDPSFYGTSHRGGEYQRMGREDFPAPKRTYFYSGTPEAHRPERMIATKARTPYKAQIEGLYDIDADPEGLRVLAQAKTPKGIADRSSAIINVLERLIDEYGYSGYVAPRSGALARYGRQKVERAD